MNCTYKIWSGICAVLLIGISACTDSSEQLPAEEQTINTAAPPQLQPPRVLDSFQVGGDIYVRSLALDEKGAGLWVGTSSGVLEIDLENREVRNTYTRKDGLASEYVFAIFIDSQEYKWFGTNAGGTSRFRDNAWDVYFPMHGLADYWVYSFAEQENGPLWIGTWAGANSVDLETMQFTTYVKELVNEWVYAIDIDSQNRVWFGTEGGISMFDNRNWKHWTHADGLGAPNINEQPASANTGLGTRSRHDLAVLTQGKDTYNPSYVFALVVDDEDQVWAGTWGGGVGVYDGQHWKNYTTQDGLAGNIVYCIASDKDGVLWFGTNHGLSRYDGKTWLTYDRHTGLLEDHVYAIAPAANGDIWVGTKRGVSIIGHEQ